MTIPDHLTRYCAEGEYPFVSLNDLPIEEAERVKKMHCAKNDIGGFYAEDDYLVHRKEIEKWIRDRLLDLGGRPTCTVPVYMVLGESPAGEYDIRTDIQRNAVEYVIPLALLDPMTVTFTYPDSMYEMRYDHEGLPSDGVRTNTPAVYLYGDIPEVATRFRVYDSYRFYIEAQVWDRKRLHEIWKNGEYRMNKK